MIGAGPRSFTLYAYDPSAPRGADGESPSIELPYPELWGALHLGRALARAGWEVKVTELSAEGAEVAQWASPNFERQELDGAQEHPTLGDA